ncbi:MULTISPECIES: hypothetical protein [unclassified Pseudomonas]|uniref:hypothetical protein n=1 Tax=unclassified Pseudomonas TaxID=196821 RepID=UPI0015A8C2C4|nr:MULTISPECIES: hypothetical protein [unclassified Pseudomonas]
MNIACQNPTLVGFKALDNRANTVVVSNNFNFGLGLDGGGNKIGDYILEILNVNIDGSAGALKYKTTTTWNNAGGAGGGGKLIPYGVRPDIFSLGSTSTTQNNPVAFTTASYDLAATATIAPKNTLDANSDISLDGAATVELIYL